MKATKRILALFLTVLMITSSVAMIFAYAETKAPVAGNDVESTPESTPEATPEKTPDATSDATPDAAAPNDDKNAGSAPDVMLSAPKNSTAPKAYDSAADGELLWNVDFSDANNYVAIDDSTTPFDNNGQIYTAAGAEQDHFKNGWRKALKSDATVIEGSALKVDFSDTTGTTDHRYIGYFPAYDLENKTYSVTFDYFRSSSLARSRFYFANGTPIYDGFACDTDMPNIGFELNASGGRLMRQSSATAQRLHSAIAYTTNENNDKIAKMKVVLSGGEIKENVALYNGTWLAESNNKHWIGDAIEVKYEIYITYDSVDYPVINGTLYQPADVPLVFGVGEYNALTDGQYYGAKNVAIYKGDTSNDPSFKAQYDAAKDGDALYTVNFSDLSNWKDVSCMTANSDGTGVTINKATAASMGGYTILPFGMEWDYGVYEIQLAVNNDKRFKIGVFDSSASTTKASGQTYSPHQKAQSVGFTLGNNNTTVHMANFFGFGNTFNDPECVTLKKYDSTTAAKRVIRNVSNDGSANVKIIFNCNENIISLFELVGTTWTKISAMKYTDTHYIVPVLDFHAYDANTNATVQNVKIIKGTTITECTDFDKDHICDVCNDQTVPHVAVEGKHTCNHCGQAVTQCADDDFDHNCDVCKAVMTECIDENKNHECDICGEAYKADEHVDTDYNHECDYGCKEPIGDHADGDDADHLCDYGCGEVADDGCHDAEKDHKCDECDGPVGEHADSKNDLDHVCDYCHEVIEECYDSATDGNHNCDACGKIAITDCIDANEDNKCDDCGADFDHLCEDVVTKDHLCDICEKPMGTKCSDIEGDGNHKCDHCGTKINDCVDNDKDHVCDECGMINMGEHVDGDDRDHDCDYCDRSVGEKCADPNGDSICNECGHAMPGSVTDRQNISTRPSGMHNKAPVHEHTYVDGWCACGKKDPDHVHAFIDSKCVCGEDYSATLAPYVLTTTLQDGDLVIIGNPKYGKLLSAKKTGFYNVGVNYSETDFSKVTNTEIFVVTVNADGTYTFTGLNGDVIALAASFASLDVTGQHKSWTLTAKGETTFLVKNVGRGNYLEWYASKGNWSTYSAGNTAEYYLSFYVKNEEHVHNHISDVHEPTCDKAGYTTYTCACGDFDKVDGDPATGRHTYVNGKCACGAEDPDYVAPAEPSKVELTVGSLGIASQKYSKGTATVGGTAFEFVQIGNYGDGIQMRDKNGNTSSLWNTTAFSSGIARIELVYSKTKSVTYSNANAVIFTFGNEKGAATYTTKLSTTAGVKTYTITPNAETYTFFKLEHDLGYTLYWDSITIVLADGTTLSV